MRIIFSRNRAAQLDLLLRSLERYAPPEPTTVIFDASTVNYLAGYAGVDNGGVDWRREDGPGRSFEFLLRDALGLDDVVTFFCDDDILYRPITDAPNTIIRDLSSVLTFSLRLGVNGLVYGGSLAESDGGPTWDWTKLDPHDHGYPGSIDGHTFRTTDVLRMIEGQRLDDPVQLESILARRVKALAAERPLMACYREQALVGVDVNSVAGSGGVRKSGRSYPQPADELNRRFLAGERIALDHLDFSRVDGCLVELPFVWERKAA